MRLVGVPDANQALACVATGFRMAAVAGMARGIAIVLDRSRYPSIAGLRAFSVSGNNSVSDESGLLRWWRARMLLRESV